MEHCPEVYAAEKLGVMQACDCQENEMHEIDPPKEHATADDSLVLARVR